jgi:OmpA-OmpF porin, OOP family
MIMMFRGRMPLAGCTVVLLAGTGAAAPAAADTSLYVGAIAGQSLFHQDHNELDAAVTDAFVGNGFGVLDGSSSIDKTDFSFGGLVGYQFTRNLSVEAGYVDLGKLSYKSTVTVTNGFTTLPATANLAAKAKGPTLAALGLLPLSPSLDVYGRAGIFFSKVTLTAVISVSNETGADSVSANSADPLLGVGLAWHMTNQVALRAEYTRFVNVGDKDKTGETNIDLFNLGVTYSFR